MDAFVLIGSFFALMMLGVPIAYSLGLASLFVESCVVVISVYALRTTATSVLLMRSEDRRMPRSA